LAFLHGRNFAFEKTALHYCIITTPETNAFMRRFTFALFTILPVLLSAQVVRITDADLVGNQSYQWTKDNTYVLDGLVFLEEGGVLNIEHIIKFTDRADVGNPSALVITRGAKIYAEGTADAPIIFTAEADDVNDPTDLGPKDNALWGGIVLLGRGITQKSGNGEVNIEGIDLSETRGLYGGNDNDDNSIALCLDTPWRKADRFGK
jgi:hypothetical protein